MMRMLRWGRDIPLILILILVASSALHTCAAGRVTKAKNTQVQAAPLHLRVTRQIEATDEAGNPFAKVYVQGGVLSQESLDKIVVAGRFPNLLFTDQTQQNAFDLWKTRSFPVELHIDRQQPTAAETTTAASPVSNGQHLSQQDMCAAVSTPDTYSESYGNIAVHELMLKDLPRCKWYKAEIERACSHIKNAVVLDVGSGTGLLSLFAARAGAKKVYAVEANPKMARLTEAVVAANGMQDIISVIAGSLEDISLPEQVDMIVSEWMGFYLLHESMLCSVLTARQRWLKKDGVMIPTWAKLLAAPVSVPQLWARKVGFWKQADQTFGLNYSAAAAMAGEELSATPQIEVVRKEAVLAQERVVWEADLTRLSVHELDLVSNDSLEFKIPGNTAHDSSSGRAMHGLCLWFSVGGPTASLLQAASMRSTLLIASHDPIVTLQPLSTGPIDAETHWKQTIIALPEPLALERPVTRLECTVALRRGSGREYLLALTVSEAASARELLKSLTQNT